MIGRRRHSKPLFGVFLVLIILVIICWVVLSRPKNPYGRETYIIVSDPMVVVSINFDEQILTLVSLPSDISSEGTHGYGKYSLAAFWRLGEIDKKDGTVLAESVSEALGIPVTGYIGLNNGSIQFRDTLQTTVKDTFSLTNIFGFLVGRFRTNIPLNKVIQLVWLFNFSRPNHVNTYNFTGNPLMVAEELLLPDNSVQQVLDPQKLDDQLNSAFENSFLRRESVTVAVYNTTEMPSLGDRVGRLLTNMGVSVVFVGNDNPEVDVCTVSGNDQAIKSKSAQVIVAVLGCNRVRGEATRADLLVRIGSLYAKRFLPN